MTAATTGRQRVAATGIGNLFVNYDKGSKRGGGLTTITADCTAFTFDNTRLREFADNVRRFADSDVYLEMMSTNERQFVVKLEGDTLHAGERMSELEHEHHRTINWPELVAAIRQIVPEWE